VDNILSFDQGFFTDEFYPGLTTPEDKRAAKASQMWPLVTGIKSMGGGDLYVWYGLREPQSAVFNRSRMYLLNKCGTIVFRITQKSDDLGKVYFEVSIPVSMGFNNKSKYDLRQFYPLIDSSNVSYILKSMSKSVDADGKAINARRLRKIDMRHMGSFAGYKAFYARSWNDACRDIYTNIYSKSSSDKLAAVLTRDELVVMCNELLRKVRQPDYASPVEHEITTAVTKLTNAEVKANVMREHFAASYANEKWVLMLDPVGGIIVSAVKFNPDKSLVAIEFVVPPRRYASLDAMPESLGKSLKSALVFEKNLAASDADIKRCYRESTNDWDYVTAVDMADPEKLIPVRDYDNNGNPDFFSYCFTSTVNNAGHFVMINRL
jgi:hypothetical protein